MNYKGGNMCFSQPVILVVMLLSFNRCNGQQIFQVQSYEEPVGVNSVGQIVPISSLDRRMKLPESSSIESVQVFVFGSVGDQMRTFYLNCPGLISAFDLLRKDHQFDLQFPPEALIVFNKVMDHAILKRSQFVSEYELRGNEFGDTIVANRRLLEKLYNQEQKADAELASVLLEVVPPDRLPRYFSALGPRYEFQLLSSRLFHDCIAEKEMEFASRLKKAQECCNSSIVSLYTPKKDGVKSHAPLPCETVYESLTVDQFLKLKFLQGRAKSGEDIDRYLSRSREGDSSMFVRAIRNLR